MNGTGHEEFSWKGGTTECVVKDERAVFPLFVCMLSHESGSKHPFADKLDGCYSETMTAGNPRSELS